MEETMSDKTKSKSLLKYTYSILLHQTIHYLPGMDSRVNYI